MKNNNNNVQVNSEWDRSDLKTPEHDKIILWLLKKENVIKLFNDSTKVEILEIKTEVPVTTSNNRFILGYVDIIVEYRILAGGQYRRLFIEVKPKLDSFGTLIRQINKYKTEYITGDWMVIHADNDKNKVREFKEALKSQKIFCIKLVVDKSTLS